MLIIFFIFFMIILSLISSFIGRLAERSDAKSAAKYEKQIREERLSYESPQMQVFHKIAEPYDKRRRAAFEKAKDGRYKIYEVAMKKGYRWKKYTENKSYYNWEEEQTEKNGRPWDWKLTEEWEAVWEEQWNKHIKKWGKSPF